MARTGCHGNGADHCCYLEGEPCPFLEMNTEPGRRWTCGLRHSHGSWAAAHADPGYLEHVKPVWERNGIADCGDFGPAEQQCCWGQYEPSAEISERALRPAQGEGVTSPLLP
jgi:hypothetical protein